MTRQSLFFCHNQLHEHGIIRPVALPYFVCAVFGVRFIQVALMWWVVIIVLSFISAIAVYSAIAIADED